jgi:ppGpp synthetase/RelA/SpoT-type nucleotidyltranferase
MIYDIDKILEEYNVRKENANLLLEEVKYLIYRALNKENIKIHYVFNRVKAFDSFLDKIRRKNLKDPFNEIHDLIGFRIICLFLEDLNKIADLLIKEFDVFNIEKKPDEVAYDVFGYMASHFQARLKNNGTCMDEAIGYTFEIQTRTIAQDAWASISHHLFYKHESFLPDNLRRDFHALSGLFYIADTHFSLLRNEQLKYMVSELQKIDDGPKSE